MTYIPKSIAECEFANPGFNSEVADAYDRLSEQVINTFDRRVWSMADACLSVIMTLALKKLTNPVGLNLVDGPSTDKTTVLSFFYGLPMVYRSDDFTPASFVTQAANIKKKEADKVDLLPRIRHRCLILPELAPTFGVDKDTLLRNFGILTRVFDGEGLLRDGAVQGRRGYEGDYHFAWLGATTPIRPCVWRLMGAMGSRFLFLSLVSHKTGAQEIQESLEIALSETSYEDKVRATRDAMSSYFDTFTRSMDITDFHRSVEWVYAEDNRSTVQHISELAALTARARSETNRWPSEPGEDNNATEFVTPIRENPKRLTSLFMAIARGHALAAGRRYVSDDDLPLIVSVAMSSIPDDRRKVIDLALESEHPDKESNAGSVTSAEVSDILGISRPTANKLLNTLSLLVIGRLSGAKGTSPLKLTLGAEFAWLCTDEFRTMRDSWREPETDFDPTQD